MADLAFLKQNETIRIDAQGEFYYGDLPIEHPRILKMLRLGLCSIGHGKYGYKLGPRAVEIDVEDTPHFVTAVHNENNEMWISSSRGHLEKFQPETLYYRENRPYCELQCGEPAKFIPRAAVSLIHWLEFETTGVYLNLNGHKRKIPGAAIEED